MQNNIDGHVSLVCSNATLHMILFVLRSGIMVNHHDNPRGKHLDRVVQWNLCSEMNYLLHFGGANIIL